MVVNTAAGRRRYMQYLIPYIVSSPIVDRYDIWINTHNGADIEFFRKIAEKFHVVNLVWQPDGVVNGNASINAFYKDCVEDKTIYFKLDDDVVWMEPQAIEKMVDFRIDNPNFFLVSPLVINNSLSTYLLQLERKLKLREYCNADSSHDVLWKSGAFALDLHNWFINNFLRKQEWNKLHLGKKEMGMTRFSINAILWMGEEMAKFKGKVPGDDEEFLSCIYPTQQGKANAWNGDTIMAHFAFFTQREHLDAGHILEKYGEECHKQWASNPKMEKIDKEVQNIITQIESNLQELMQTPSPYKKIVKKPTIKSRIKALLPKIVVRNIEMYRVKDYDNHFILG